MSRTRYVGLAMVISLAAALPARAGHAGGQAVGVWKAIEVAAAASEADEALLGRPIALAVDAASLYVADAQDCAVKVFSKDGRFLRAIGRKGRGPGELLFPSGVSVIDGKVHVADKLNRRIQIFDGEGKACGGFAVPFAPDKVVALDGKTLLVSGNPTGFRTGEMLLHIYDAAGRLRWEGLEARSSSDPVFDAFRNMILVCPGSEREFYVVFRNGERAILHFAGTGVLRERIPVDERHAFKPLDLPFKGLNKRLLGFCWAAARDRGLFYLSEPEAVDGKDLGPGRRISVVGDDGRLRAVVELPRAVHRFVVEDRRVFAIDDEGALRIFDIVPPSLAEGIVGASGERAEGRICSSLEEAAPLGAGPVLLVFFSTDCPACYDDLFESRYLVDKGRWPVSVVGVSSGLRDDLRTFLDKHVWPLPVVLDRRKDLFRRFKVDAVPFKALLLGTEAVYRDDPYRHPDRRREELKECLNRLFSR